MYAADKYSGTPAAQAEYKKADRALVATTLDVLPAEHAGQNALFKIRVEDIGASRPKSCSHSSGVAYTASNEFRLKACSAAKSAAGGTGLIPGGRHANLSQLWLAA